MNKALCTAVMAVAALSAAAEGYQVNTFSAKQIGMGHVGVAMKLGAESQIFNPAGVAFSDKTLELSGAVAAIKSSATATLTDGSKFSTSSKIATPMNVSASFRIYDNLYAGVAFYTPYGSTITWGRSWPGAVMNQSVDLKMFTVQPTVSWRILPNLSVGAGLMIGWGTVNLDKALVSARSMDRVIDLQYQAALLKYNVARTQAALTGQPFDLPEPQQPQTKYGLMPPASVNLKGSSELALGVNVGAMWDITSQWTVGASFRSKMNLHVKAGDARVDYADEMARAVLGETLDNLNYTNFDASMPAPWVFTFGASYKPVEKLLLAFDAQLNGWGTYKYLDFKFDQLPEFDQHLKKDYHNAWTLHLGGQYSLTERLDLRAGMMVDFTPCNKDYYNPETPGMTRIEPAVGLSFRPIRNLSIDFSLMYAKGLGTECGKGSFADFLAPQYNAGLAEYNAGVAAYNAVLSAVGLPAYQGADLSELPAEQEFAAKYNVHAILPAIGISYSF